MLSLQKYFLGRQTEKKKITNTVYSRLGPSPLSCSFFSPFSHTLIPHYYCYYYYYYFIPFLFIYIAVLPHFPYSLSRKILSYPSRKAAFTFFVLYFSLFLPFGFWVSVFSLSLRSASKMGFTNSIGGEPPNASSSTPFYASSEPKNHYCDYNDLKLKSILKKMVWELGLSCVLPPRRRRSSVQNDDAGAEKKNAKNLEHNKAWLLAESGGCGGAELTSADPQSVHSSFRFSFCSQVELESMNMSSSTAATVLMVNLDNGLCESRAKELKWRRIESLERSISPVANTLIRFSYAEILAATRSFSKGTLMGLF